MSTTTTRQTRLQFRSRYMNVSTYDVVFGPMHGKTISVKDSDLESYERNWNGGHNWNLTRAEFERDQIGGAGMIVCGNQPVTEDVMEAYRLEILADLDKAEQYAIKHKIEDMGPDYFAKLRAELDAKTTGFWRDGWHRTAPTPVALAA